MAPNADKKDRPLTEMQKNEQTRKELLKTLSRSEQRQTILRSRAKMSVVTKPVQTFDIDALDKLEMEVRDLRGKNYNLKRQVVMFQQLMRNQNQLNDVLARLENENLIGD